ncbi:hypothetical protein EDEG_00628 [Edhazardia aedis USNM 41457]|uniref:Uncharacterized protein n=1 Tax=Edhazardia aedis (strain USNM 41457) TaxID=1003232 RepID=J9DRX5_EDHAE|nr:hypothetical protein EDEG_00628 [Edhazardia aedis USNM 41457]|eukprot:EJW05325.1 hypothetical protein EDEG_00628 [Edhazardia aedis USNM 41457]
MSEIYRIKLHKTQTSLFKTDSTQKITKLLYKKSGFITLNLSNDSNFSLLKERLGFVNMQEAYKTDTRKMYFGLVNHQRKIVDIFPIDGLYKFEHVFTKNTEKVIKKLDPRLVSKEELEHRKKSINYKVKKIENENDYELIYEKDFDINEMLQNLNEGVEKYDIQESVVTKNVDVSDDKNVKKVIIFENKIRKSIYNARIVNFELLNEIYNDKQLILKCLSEMCIKLSGRFVLKNKFYKKNLREHRNFIFSMFVNKEYIDSRIIQNMNNQDLIFLVNEIADFQDKKYYLKGVVENISLTETHFDIEAIIKNNGVTSKKKLKNILKLEDDEVNELIKNDMTKKNTIIQLSNGAYVYNDNTDVLRSACISLFQEKSKFKRNDLFKYMHMNFSREITLVEFGQIVKEFCVAEGNVWVLKSGD